MRDALPRLRTPDNVSLAYGAWAPVGADGKVPDGKRAAWLDGLAALPVSPDYRHAFARWQAGFARDGDRTAEMELVSRLLVGHGNPGATGVGLTVHHTWGVPVVPGSALKGLVAHHVDAVYGPDDPARPPWEQAGEERERARYQGPTWDGRRLLRGPGEEYRAIFGAPEADEDAACREHDVIAGAAAGEVVFHDALYVPGSADGDRPFAADVITVHQKTYYDSAGGDWPNDYDSPNPVGFLTVRPRVRLLLALSGPPALTALVERLLGNALAEWGVGAKTSSGYGRMVPVELGGGGRGRPAAPGRRFSRGERITVTRVEDRKKGRPRFEAPDGHPGSFAEASPSIEVGATADVWVANVSDQTYTLTLKPPRPSKAPKGGRR